MAANAGTHLFRMLFRTAAVPPFTFTGSVYPFRNGILPVYVKRRTAFYIHRKYKEE